MNQSDLDARLQELLEQLDSEAELVRAQVVELAFERLRRLAGKMVRESFPRLQGREESVIQETVLRLLRSLSAAAPRTVADLFRFAAHKMRQVLLDLAQQAGRPPASPLPEAETTQDPVRLAEWTEFHQQVELLPAEQQSVFELRYYLGMKNVQAAQVLGISEKAASRLWIAATESLLDAVPDCTRFV